MSWRCSPSPSFLLPLYLSLSLTVSTNMWAASQQQQLPANLFILFSVRFLSLSLSLSHSLFHFMFNFRVIDWFIFIVRFLMEKMFGFSFEFSLFFLGRFLFFFSPVFFFISAHCEKLQQLMKSRRLRAAESALFRRFAKRRNSIG